MRCLRISILPALLFFCMALVRAQVAPAPAHITFTTIDVPGAGYTGVWAINMAGDMVGNYGQDTNSDSHGFLYSNGAFTYFDYPGESVTVPKGINDSNLIVGDSGRNPVVGFLYDGTTFTTIRHGSDSATYTNGINNAAELVGGTGTINSTKGFKLRDGKFKRLNVPGQFIYVYGTGINNLGQIVGWSDDDGFVCRQGSCQLVDVPGASKTEALGINDNGVIVGGTTWRLLVTALPARTGSTSRFATPVQPLRVLLGSIIQDK